MNNFLKWFNWRYRFYRVHVYTGLVAAIGVLLIAMTGVLINHQEYLGLLDIEISDRYLPDDYRPDFRTGTTRLNVIITDLHSGRILGDNGHWVSDGISLLLVISLFSGALSYLIRQRFLNPASKESFKLERGPDEGSRPSADTYGETEK
jgi:uncharacterized iron-regulated membrane protein